MVKVIFIGDQHFKTNNIEEVDIFIKKITKLTKDSKPDFIVLAGDLLDRHEKLHTIPLNKASNFINNMRLIAPTFVLVGNHDFIGNQEFLTENHWLNPFKYWDNVTIVDKTILHQIDKFRFIFVPYVYPGRFMEALNSFDEGRELWKTANCIFAHQEFRGCKMGCFISEIGDVWSEDSPHVISGHIHINQRPQSNIYYPGSALQESSSTGERTIIPILTFDHEGYETEEINLKLPKKYTIYIEDISKFEDFDKNSLNLKDKITISISGNIDEFKTLKNKSTKYKELVNQGNIKIQFKETRKQVSEKNKKLQEIIDDNLENITDFKKILHNIVTKEQNEILYEDFKSLIEL